MNTTPYISFIGFARNDAYVPDRTIRHNFSLNVLLKQLKELKLPSEIIIIEWNFPEDSPPLSDVIQVNIATEWTKLRIIRVPNRYHKKYKILKFKPFHVGAAVNVGIRRALGKFILPMASDVFLTTPCLEFISQRTLDKNCFYRCDRCDVDPIVVEEFKNLDENFLSAFFSACETHTRIRHRKLDIAANLGIADLHTNGAGDFCLVSREKIEEIRGFKENDEAGGLDVDGLVVHALNGLGLKEEILSDGCKAYKIFHQRSTSRSVCVNWRFWHQYFEFLLVKAGFPDAIPRFRMLLNYPKRYYSYMPNVLFTSYEKNFIQVAQKWMKKKPPFYLNDENWGLKNEQLEERVILR